MSQQDENTTSDTSSETSPVAAASAAAAAGMAIGTITAGPVIGILFALIWGAQAALIAATRHETDANDVN